MKRILLLSIASLAVLMADFTLIGEELTPTVEETTPTTVAETPPPTSNTINSYLEPVEIPAYDPNDPTHVLITPTNGNWKESVMNNLDYKHFYIAPGNYTGSIIWLKSSGTENDRRTLSLYDPSMPTDDTHPASLPDNKQADVDINFSGASYWTLDRLSYLDHGVYADYYMMEMNNYSTHNIINRHHARNMYRGIYIRPFNDFNTVQNSYFNGASHAGRVADALGVGLTHSNTPNAVTEGTKIINNDIRNLGDGIQLVKSFQSAETISFPDTVIDSNRIWVDGDIYTDGDWSTNGYNPNGKFMVAENALDFKSGSDNPSRPVIVSNNIAWGYRQLDETTGQNNGAGTVIPTSDTITNVNFESNIIFDSQNGMNLVNMCSGSVKNNILYNIGEFNPSSPRYPDGATPLGIRPTYDINCPSTPSTTFDNNTIIKVGTNQAGVGHTMEIDSSVSTMSLKSNLFIDTQRIYGNADGNIVDNSWYSNHTGEKLGGTNEYNMDDVSSQMGDYTFEYERFTSHPKTKTVVGVISTPTSPHYEKAGSSITTIE